MVRKNLPLFGAAIFVFLASFWLGSSVPFFVWGPSSDAKANPKNSELFHAAVWREYIDTKDAGELFDTIYNTGLREYLRNKDLQEAVKARFQRNYAPDTDLHLQPGTLNEMAARLGILKVLGQSFRPETSTQNPEPLLHFYQDVLANAEENWIVKRQALQNLAAWTPLLDQKTRDQILASQDPKAISLAGKSERDILKEANENHAF